ncbi:MAG: hypothetical protein AAB592_03120 [Patescibacteria group bacterium]
MKQCRWCDTGFEVSDEDRRMYEKLSPVIAGVRYDIPEPTLCPPCRHLRRIAWRNEHFLYKRACGLCAKSIVTMYPPENKFPIYCAECFWSDRWDALSYGASVDFSRPIFEQINELWSRVPQLWMFSTNNVNSDYALNCIYNKNCYLTSGADFNEDCMYGINTQRSKNSSDHYLIYDSELCYGCMNSSRLYSCVGCQESESCTDSWFLYDCKNVRNCAFSSNLRNKQYVIFNEQISKEDYEKKLDETLKNLFRDPSWLFTGMIDVMKKAVHRESLIINGENCTGDNIRNSKNQFMCFDAEDAEDCRYCIFILDVKDCMDLSAVGWGELMYEMISSGRETRNDLFCGTILAGQDLMYCRAIWNSKNCFGSTSLTNHKEYVIFNKQYSKEEYEKLVPRIIEHMRKTGEWGEFMPPAISPFEYNRSMGADYIPLPKEEVLRRGFKWHESGEQEISHAQKLSESPKCVTCGREFRIIAQELELYAKLKIPSPKNCWPCRLQSMIKMKKRYSLKAGICSECKKVMQTPYEQGDGVKVLCERCYLLKVY